MYGSRVEMAATEGFKIQTARENSTMYYFIPQYYFSVKLIAKKASENPQTENWKIRNTFYHEITHKKKNICKDISPLLVGML